MSGPTRPTASRSSSEATQSGRPGVSRTASSGPENYACPFAKRDPIKYSHFNPDSSGDQEYRSCSTGVMRNISRLKQHLTRTHKDEMTDEQTRLVMERISGDHAQGWYNIYRILFPDQPLPATPYAEYVTGEHLRRMFKHIASRLPFMLYQIACATEFPGQTPLSLERNTRFPTKPEHIILALQKCQQEFGQAQGLSHVFQTKSPTMEVASSSRSTTRPRHRQSQDPRMAQSMGTFSTGNSPDDEEMSGMSGSEEFEEQLALRTIEDYDIYFAQMRKSDLRYSPIATPVYPPYTAFQVSPQMAYDNSNTFTTQRRRS